MAFVNVRITVVPKRLDPVAQLRRMLLQVCRRLRIRDATISDQLHIRPVSGSALTITSASVVSG